MIDFKYFDPRIVLDFEPEAFESESRLIVEDYLFVVGQRLDLKEGILYAESEIIPKLLEHKKNHFKDLTPEQLLEWMQQIHKRVGQTLVSKAGMYADQTVLRWHKGAQMQTELAMAVASGKVEELEKVFADNGLPGLSRPFFAILERVSQDKTVNETEVNRPQVREYFNDMLKMTRGKKLSKEESKAFKRASSHDKKIYKLMDAKHQGKLKNEELAVINQVFTICLSPEEIPSKSLRLMQEFIGKLQSARSDDLDGIIHLCAFLFQQLTQVHPFSNANGRTALMMTNTFLAAFGQKTIMLREPGEKGDPTSTYSQAVDKMDTDLSLLESLFKSRLDAQYIESCEQWQDHELTKIRMQFADELRILRAGNVSAEMLNQYFIGTAAQRIVKPPKENFPEALRHRFEQLTVASDAQKAITDEQPQAGFTPLLSAAAMPTPADTAKVPSLSSSSSQSRPGPQ